MDDVPIIGQRELRREFEDDRCWQALLAMAFEALSGASRPNPPNTDSVQTMSVHDRELLLQEDN